MFLIILLYKWSGHLPIEKERTTQIVYKQIKKAILFGGITGDEVFTKVQLAEGLNTSRTPVRAAIQDFKKQFNSLTANLYCITARSFF
ncbi:hypothetical protein [Peribacillus sp. NPDC056705]